MLPEIIVYYLLLFVGFTSNEANVMTCTAKYESGLNPNAVNMFNDNNTIDIGLFQINSVHWGKVQHCHKETLFNPIDNAKCAREIYLLQGFNAWYAFQKYKDKCANYEVKL